MFTCQCRWHPCLIWDPHLWCECPSVVWGASYVFAGAERESCVAPSHHCTVYCRDCVVVQALAHESAFPGPVHFCPRLDVYVTWSSLVHTLRDPLVVVAEERDFAMESYLAALSP